jgi:predicted phage-related endonuclease
MFWFNKNNPDVEFCDIREVGKHEYYPNRYIEIKPDTVCDFTNLPFKKGQFKLVVFDPPHLHQVGETSWLALKYGFLKGDWREMIRKGFSECMRVLDEDGVLIFKWSEVQISLREILPLFDAPPLFGHRSGKHNNTHWICFMKETEEQKMNNIKWTDRNQIQIDPPKRTKKITGTRFGTILGLNPWSTAFEIWCAITKTYEKPFEDTIYTLAGKAIEPKQIEYMRKTYLMDNLRTPTDVYGSDYFNKTWGDFYKDNPIFGGMWDSLLVDENGKPETVIEFKTTKRSEDWATDIPEYYALQVALYAYLLGVDEVIMVASFLEEQDYESPELFLPSVKNTITVEFKVSERYPDFGEMVAQGETWWKDHVATGLSPAFDEKKDNEILTALRTNSLSPETDIKVLVAEGEELKKEIDKVSATMTDKEKRLKKINDLIKEHALSQFRDGDKKVEVRGDSYIWTVARSETTSIDKDALASDGLLDKYSKISETYRMTVK